MSLRIQLSTASLASKETVWRFLEISFPTNVEMMENVKETPESVQVPEFVHLGLLNALTILALEDLISSVNVTSSKIVLEHYPMDLL